jgi:hypothetical protein
MVLPLLLLLVLLLASLLLLLLLASLLLLLLLLGLLLLLLLVLTDAGGEAHRGRHQPWGARSAQGLPWYSPGGGTVDGTGLTGAGQHRFWARG